MAALKLMIPDDQVGSAGVDALKLMIPDDQVGIAVVDLWYGWPIAYDPR